LATVVGAALGSNVGDAEEISENIAVGSGVGSSFDLIPVNDAVGFSVSIIRALFLYDGSLVGKLEPKTSYTNGNKMAVWWITLQDLVKTHTL
jgi:hypothetical protein